MSPEIPGIEGVDNLISDTLNYLDNLVSQSKIFIVLDFNGQCHEKLVMAQLYTF